MAVSRFQQFFLKMMVYGSLGFRPEALDPELSTEDSAKTIHRKFRALPEEEKEAYHAYFKSRPFIIRHLPVQVYLKTGKEGDSARDYGIHWEGDLPDRKTEAQRLVLAGFDLNRLNGNYYTFAQLRELRRAYESGLDITPLLNNGFSRFQYKILVPALRNKFDISELLNPDISARKMACIYYEMYEGRFLYIQQIKKTQKELEDMGFEPDPLPVHERKDPEKAALDDMIAHAKEDLESRKNVIRFPGRVQETPVPETER